MVANDVAAVLHLLCWIVLDSMKKSAESQYCKVCRLSACQQGRDRVQRSEAEVNVLEASVATFSHVEKARFSWIT